MLTTEYTKAIYEKENMVNFYQDFTKEIQLLKSEKIILDKYFTKKFNILDIGCGTGRTTIGLKKSGFRAVTGIDISKKMIKKAQMNFKDINFKEMDATEMSFESSSFEGAFFSFNGIMLIPTLELRKKAFKEIFRVLKPGGVFIFSTPYLDNKLDKDFWKDKLKRKENESSTHEFGDIFVEDTGVKDIYIHVPFKKEIVECIEEAGFELKDSMVRMDICYEEAHIEEMLDDNLYWVVKKGE